MERAEPMAEHGRRIGRGQGKRLVEDHGPDGELALRLAIEVEEKTVCHDAWSNGYIEGLHDALRECEGRRNLSVLDTP